MAIPLGVSEKANYVTCPKGHKLYVMWSPDTGHLIDVRIVRKLKSNERPV